MKFITPIGAAFGLGLLTLWGCGDQGMSPEISTVVAAAKGGAAACPTPADVVVTTDAELRAAILAAAPGDVIALDGLIEVATSRIVVATDDVTLTCATAGSGLFGGAGSDFSLLWVTGNRVSVNRLELDGRQVTTPYIGFGDDLDFTHNSILNGVIGSWFQGAARPYVAHNSYDATDPSTGVFSSIQIQGGTTEAVVERNVVVGQGRTGIRLRSGINHVVDQNSVSGAWHESMRVVSQVEALTGVTITSNQLEGATTFGLVVGGQAPFIATDNDVRNNNIENAGQAGVSVGSACGNTFQGNNLNHNPIGLIFQVVTGDNTYRGNKNVVQDDGDFDCDGDGNPDPNQIGGK